MEQACKRSEVATQDKDAPPAAPSTSSLDGDLVESDLLVEEVSIDGMCGVY